MLKDMFLEQKNQNNHNFINIDGILILTILSKNNLGFVMNNKFQVENKSEAELSKRSFFREASALGAGMALFATSMSTEAQTTGSYTLVTLELKMKPGKAESFCTEILGPALPVTRRFDGFINLVVYIENGQDAIFIVEKWKTKEHYEKYLKFRMDAGLGEMLAPFITAPPAIRFFDPRPE
jgi:quinol monooxygenase YgiN